MIDGQGIPDIWKELRRLSELLAQTCPYKPGDYLNTEDNQNPATRWPGTTWEKQENVFIRGTGSGETSGTVGGADSVSLSVANLPAHNHPASGSSDTQGNHSHTANHNHSASQSAHTHSQPAHTHVTEAGGGYSGNGGPSYAQQEGTWRKSTTSNAAGGDTTGSAQPGVTVNTTNVTTSTNGNHSHNITVSTGNTGSGTAVTIIPRHKKVHIWKRLT